MSVYTSGSQPFFSHGPLFNNYQAYGPPIFMINLKQGWYGLFYFKTTRRKVNSTDIKKLVKKKAEMTNRCTLRGMQKSDKLNIKIMLDCMVVSPKNNTD